MPAQAERIAWELSLDQARQRAAKDKKVVLIDFSAAPVCSGCVAMDRVTYSNPGVAQFVEQHCIPFRVRIRENRRLADDYLVRWTPNIIFADDEGKIHYRVEGYFHPHDFVAQLSLGVGRYDLNRDRFAEAAERYETVAERHHGTEAAAEALYWLGVARFKDTHDQADLNVNWQRLAEQ